MAKLKIISNPYIKRVSFQSWDDNANLWKDISFENKNSSNSKLLKEKLIKSFFPFKMNEIIDIIIEDYRIGNERVDVIFEGTNDEYKELVELCGLDKYAETVSLTKSKKYLENARDILPEINELFDEKLRPLIVQSVRDYEKISKELAMYADASNDIIPICVLGNYSSGKSTFINALIGSEILPSGAEPITAKIYKIKQSSQSDRATVQFRFNEEPVKLRINDCEFMFTAGTSENNLTEKIKSELACLDEPTLTLLVNKTLEIINEYASISSDDFISDIIEIEVPFISGLWGEATRQFVIFDTPGSNSATNVNHLVVLKEAMQGFTNGLPIFISELDKLDSTDNENLYKLIEEMKELDSRFTMIVVNKSDSAELDRGGFSKEKEKKILRETIPKNLYAGGIYFVSSVIGLGAKNNGEFIDDHYAELFDEKKKKFSDTSSRFYKMLYSYNIMPEQLKKKTLDMAEQCQNILFANSGLFSVEKEIQNFAGKHSSYNKCQQSQLFLGKIIDITSNEIETAKTEREISKQHRDEQLKNDEKKLISEIEISSDKSQKDYVVEYDNYMESLDNEIIAVVSAKELKEREESIEQVKKAEHNYDTHSAEAKDSVDKMFEAFKNDGLNLFKKHNAEAFKTLGENLSSGFTEMNKKREAVEQVQKSVDKETAKNLLESVTEEFKCNFDSAQETLDKKSKQYWENKAQEFKNLLIKIVTGTNVLNEDKRQEIAEIIITYGSIVFENHAEEIFLGEDFKKGFKFFDIVLWESDKLDINKLSNKFNYEMLTNVTEMRKTIQTSHKDSFRKWKENLVSTIIANIVEYSPMLHSQAQIIKEETEKIHELESRQRQLSYYTESIRKMMDWKEI